MAFYMPFNDRNLEMSFFMLKPTGECVDDIIDVLKQISLYTASLGCIQSSILQSIHGNLIIWNGAWIKRSKEKKILLSAALLSMLSNLADMATLMDHSFFNSYTGESRDGTPAMKFYTGDIVSLSAASLVSASESNENSVAYACLAMFKDRFRKMVGANCGVCLRSQSLPRIACLFVWDTLQSCYSYILTTDYTKAIIPYLDGFSLDIKQLMDRWCQQPAILLENKSAGKPFTIQSRYTDLYMFLDDSGTIDPSKIFVFCCQSVSISGKSQQPEWKFLPA